MPERIVYFAHGKESGPWGTKISRLAEVAKQKGFATESPDYSSTMDADERVRMLLALKPAARDCLVLAGSSMGGYVATVASRTLKPAGLFLLAPAFYIPGCLSQAPAPGTSTVEIVHGWNDDVVPVDHSICFARRYQSSIHLLNAGHRLTEALGRIEELFACFLDRLAR